MELKEFELNFICHSLGGIIARACLKYLQSHKDRLNSFVSICSPHLGYLYHSSTLISTSLWILNKVKKDPSMIELTMSDSSELDVRVDWCRKLTCMDCQRVKNWAGSRRFGCLGPKRMNTCPTGPPYFRTKPSCLKPRPPRSINSYLKISPRISSIRLYDAK